MKQTQVNELQRRRWFDETFKRHAVEPSLRGERTVRAVAEELGISPDRLYLWRGLYAPKPTGLAQVEEDNRRLRAEVLRLREREIVLKKSLGILSETPESGMPRSRS